ncbi:hypothetical protein M758_12G038600 [Ceratodon purpureus]|uniref:J domain-containing protein n=1 Tax=Ceratodon purpureus TaxID=3225 RepID=A0A8T0G4D2_CERPU|nr:hypothetical protein KC19_12G037900 [Ceratodon purpureus]KAG0598023.1 hypothetical protein M758_12G038600 [Ceratodon purpureus]
MAAVGASGAFVAVSPRRSSALGLIPGEESSSLPSVSLFFGQRCGVLLLSGELRRRRLGAWAYATDADHLRENPPPAVRSSGHFSGKTLYDLLGVGQLATPEQIKSAYRNKALHVHPDVVPEDQKEEATKNFLEIKMAYRILSDRQQRAAYDLKLRFVHRTPISTPTPSQWGFISVPSSSDDPSGTVTFRGRKNWDSDMFS